MKCSCYLHTCSGNKCSACREVRQTDWGKTRPTKYAWSVDIAVLFWW